MFFVLNGVAQQWDDRGLEPLKNDKLIKKRIIRGEVEYRFYKKTKDGVEYPIYKKNTTLTLEIDEKICVQISQFKMGDKPKSYRDGGKNYKYFKLVVDEACIRSENLKPIPDFYQIDESINKEGIYEKDEEVCFNVINSGKASIEIYFEITKYSSNEVVSACNNGSLSRKFDKLIVNKPQEVVKVSDSDGDGVPDSLDNCINEKNLNQEDIDKDGIGDACDDIDNRIIIEKSIEVKKPKPIDPFDTIDKTNLNDLCAYLSKNKGAQKAIDAIKKIDQKIWSETQITNTKVAYQQYRDTLSNCPYTPMHIENVKAKINYFEISETWEKLKINKDEDAIIDFYKQHGDYKSEVVSFIKTEFPVLKADLKKITEKKYVIIPNNSIKPRYKDLSLNEGILIDDTKWADTLSIEIIKHGRYEILIRDEFGRDTSLLLNYTFEVTIIQTSKDYKIEVSGGEPPFQTIIKQNEEEIHIVDGTQLNKSLLKEQEKVKENEKYDIVLRDATSYEIKLLDPLKIEKSISIKVIQTIILLIAVAIIFIIIFFLIKKRKHKTYTIQKA